MDYKSNTWVGINVQPNTVNSMSHGDVG